MATAPRINYFDGSGTTTSLTITTNLPGLIFTGEIDSNVVDIQININNSGWVSDPTLVDLALPNFTLPNLNSLPDGLELELGSNIIKLRAIDLSGSFSPESVISAKVIPDVEAGANFAPPSGIRIQRNATSITLQWSALETSTLFEGATPTGYNIYAATTPGGAETGYLRLNEQTIPSSSPTETIVEEFAFPQPQGNEITLDFINPNPVDRRTLEPSNLLVLTTKLQETTDGLLDPAAETQAIAVNVVDLLLTEEFRVNFRVSELRSENFYSFTHDRNDGIGRGVLNSETFSTVDPEDPIYYVVTNVYYNKNTGQLLESRYSQEISGAPLPLDATIRGIRIREQAQITADYINEINSVQPTLALIPGSTVREVHIEPFANEVQKVYFLMDFVHRAKSFEALLQIDDPGRTGVSTSVIDSAYKQSLRTALSLSSDTAVQSLIDVAFDSLASNFGVVRRGLRASTVTQTFFTTTAPTSDLVITQDAVVSSSTNTAAPRFRANGAAVLSASNAQAYFNQENQRYEIKIQMVADIAGSIGNVPAGDLDTIVAGASGFETVNEVAADFGRNIASNLELAEDASRALYSLDTGTTGGYKTIAIGTPGVLEVRIVESGDPYMMRDYDEVREKHIGGKVDIYIKGSIERTISEKFAFQFEIANSIRFDVIDPDNLVFRARDSRLTENNPINEMLYNPSQNLGLRNQSLSPTEEYDLTGVTIQDYRTIRLVNTIPQPETLLDDFVEGDYRFRSNNKFISSLQPIIRVVSVIGEISGSLDTAGGYDLYKIEDPLLNGYSTSASDYVEINQVDDIPSGDSISVNAEEHVLIGQYEEPLGSVGINIFTLVVYNEDRTIEYNGPESISPDYLIEEGSQTSPVKIVRSTSSNIPSGSTISVDYEHDENFTITYVVNDVLQRIQSRIRTSKHATADVITKQAVENPLSTETTVQLEANADQTTVDSDIRTSVTVLTDSKGVGGDIHQSDMTATIDNVEGVDFLTQPLTKFTLQDGSLRIRDEVNSSSYTFLSSLSQSVNAVYILAQALPFDTTDGGGPDTIHHGVFMDDLQLEQATSLDNVGTGLNKGWIIGKNGAVIDGYSDDATLEPEFVTESAITEERINRTANKIVVSLDYGQDPPDVPSDHTFSASYVVNGDTGAKNIEVSRIEYLTPGDLTLTYRTATE
jgi:hypothetical protein